MADIEVVIKIDEKLYKDIYSDAEIMIYEGMRSGKTLLATLLRAIRNGTHLPKGHGRILDEKDILDIEKNEGWMYDLFDMPDYIADVSAIIEADNGESEDKE